MDFTTAVTFTASVLILLLLTLAFHALLLHPLSRVPGPFLASISNAWYAYHVRNGSLFTLGKALHRQYGPVVRVCPNEVWFDSKEAYRIIYSKSQSL